MAIKYMSIIAYLLIGMILGGLIGYFAMPEKIKITERVILPTCPIVNCVMPECPIAPACAVCKKCTYEKAAITQTEEKEVSLKDKIYTMTSSRTCEDYMKNKGTDTEDLPKCVLNKKVTLLTDTSKGCTIAYLAGQC